MTMKALIVDDEPLIVSGLQKLIPWDEYGITIAGTAQNGVEAWDKIMEVHPQLLLADISMPLMNGLEILKRLLENNIEIQVIFFSGFQEFSYVREAISLGAVDYLLKPIRPNELIVAIRKAELRMKEKQNSKAYSAEENIIQDFFQQENPKDKQVITELTHKLQALGIQHGKKYFTGVCIGLEPSSEGEEELKRELMRFSAFNKIHELFCEQNDNFFIAREETCVSYLFMLDDENSKRILYEKIIGLLSTLEEKYGIILIAGIGETVCEISSLLHAYKTSRFVFDMHFFEDNRILQMEELHREYNSSFEEYDRLYEEILQGFQRGFPDMKCLLEDCMDLIYKLHYGNKYAVINRCIVFSGNIFNDVKKYYGESIISTNEENDFINNLRNQNRFKSIKDLFVKFFLQYYSIICEFLGSSGNKEILIIKRYIEEHYKEKLTLEEMSKLVNMNSFYLSSLFKKKTGHNFKDYLLNNRMEHALKLVRTTDMKTYEIAEAVGYTDVRQFTNKFRQLYHDSPMEYRKKLRNKSTENDESL